MTRPEHHPGAEHEPHLRPRSATDPGRLIDPSEAKARRLLGRAGPDADHVSAQHAVTEEPVLRGRMNEPINRDWSCAGCGYNVRGLQTGQACPECGTVIHLAPPPTAGPGYANWLQERIKATGWGRSWLVVAAVAALAGPWAVLGALLQGAAGYWGVVVMAPVVEEAMKVALIGLVIELRPYWFKSASQIFVAAVGSGLVFASIENVLYLFVYFPNPGPDIIAWRLVVCTALHVGCTSVAAVGAWRSWETVVTELRPTAVPVQLPWLVLAMVLHGAYNGTVTFLEMTGLLF